MDGSVLKTGVSTMIFIINKTIAFIDLLVDSLLFARIKLQDMRLKRVAVLENWREIPF